MDLREIGFWDVDLIHLWQDRAWCNMVINLHFL
jgi:hypothetical protein